MELIVAAIVSTIVNGIATGFVEKGGADLMTAIREKLTQARRQGILEDLQQEQTEENKSEFQLALKTQMDKDTEFKNKVREIMEQIELERQKNSPTPENAVTGAFIEPI